MGHMAPLSCPEFLEAETADECYKEAKKCKGDKGDGNGATISKVEIELARSECLPRHLRSIC